MSQTQLMAASRKRSSDTGAKVPKVKSKAFWNGVIQGLSGPTLLGTRPEAVEKLVRVNGKTVSLKIGKYSNIGKTKSARAFGSEQVAKALSLAVREVMKERGLVQGVEVVKRLDSHGKLRDMSRLKISRRANPSDAPAK